MDLALSLPTKARSWEVAKRAEELGYTHAWFYDTELLNAEVFVAMGAAAMKTSRIKLCAGVLIPSNRIAPVAASGLATFERPRARTGRLRRLDRLHRPPDIGSGSGHARAARKVRGGGRRAC